MLAVEIQDSATGQDAGTAASNLLECIEDSSVAISSKKLQNFEQCGAAKHDDKDSKGPAWIG